MANINEHFHFLLLVFLSSTFLHLETVKLGSCKGVINASCIETDRQALVNFKKGLTDPLGRLSSWVGQDCCRWRGVVCSQLSVPRVIKLKLRNQYASSPDTDDEAAGDDYGAAHALGGKISHSLLNLKDLRYLDFSMNNFGGFEIPEFIGSFKRLRYLNLSSASFGGAIPPSLGNLSSLLYLDLNSNSLELVDNDLRWLSGLSSLKHLNLGNVDLTEAAASWHQAVNSISSLMELRLPRCGLSSLPDQLLLPFDNITSLLVLDLSNNDFNSSIPNWLFNLSSLAYLDLNNNNLQGSVPEGFGYLTSLEYIDLSFNFFIGGHLPRNLGRLCNLRILELSFNSMSGEITEFADGLSGCVNGSSLQYLDLGFNYKLGGFLPNSLGELKSLKSLQLSSNSFVGSIPNPIGNLTCLQKLYISDNQMNGIIPESVGRLSEMVALDLSENPWVGVVTESHFSNLTSLTELVIKKSTPNVTLVFNVSSEWVPPFKLNYLELQSCQLGPKFPAWLRNQNRLKTIVLNNARISDFIPDWFWKLDLQLETLDFASNQLSGRVPNSLRFIENATVDLSSNCFHGPFPDFSSNLSSLYLRDNFFSGPIPLGVGITMPRMSNFDISWNNLNGTIPLSMGKMNGLSTLVLSNNHLSGEIPLIWKDKPDLYLVDMANNSLSGEIPSSMGTLNSLMFLTLSGNKLSGTIPSSLQNCKDAISSFDLGNNKLSGNLPSWIGKMKLLLILSLRSNFFDGNIPSEICSLSHLHILDLAQNNLSGSLPSCLGNLRGMATEISGARYEGQLTVVMKGRELIYQNTLYLVNSIDLSDNNLSGKLPELRNLSRLGTLNLSINHFTGNIPEDIGSLSQLETLDLSRNQLSGPIPPTMISLTSLNHLNLSYNRLSGKIPTSNQFQTLNDPSIYSNNLALCGQPLVVKCQEDAEPTDPSGVDNGDHDNEHEDEFEMKLFYVSMGIGFVVGFWGIFGPLILNRSWRGAYFRFLDEMKDRVMVVITVNVARLGTKCKWERKQH